MASDGFKHLSRSNTCSSATRIWKRSATYIYTYRSRPSPNIKVATKLFTAVQAGDDSGSKNDHVQVLLIRPGNCPFYLFVLLLIKWLRIKDFPSCSTRLQGILYCKVYFFLLRVHMIDLWMITIYSRCLIGIHICLLIMWISLLSLIISI